MGPCTSSLHLQGRKTFQSMSTQLRRRIERGVNVDAGSPTGGSFKRTGIAVLLIDKC